MIETTRNAAASIVVPASNAASSAATAAPPANGARKKPSVAISPNASTTARISQIAQDSTESIVSEVLRREQRFGEVVGVERPQVLELLADADQLDRDPELVGDRQRDASLGRPVELREDDPGDVDGLAEELRLTDAVLTGGRVHGHQGLVRRIGHLLGDHTPD